MTADERRNRETLERLRALSMERAAQPGTHAGGDPTRVDPTRIEPLPPSPPDPRESPDELRPTMPLARTAAAIMEGHAARTQDSVVTSRIQRVQTREQTPAPLPPTPGAEAAADTWFEQVPTSPAVVDLAYLSHGSGSGISSITPPRRVGGPTTARGETHSRTSPIARVRIASAAGPPWLMPALVVATSLAVGMVLGAVLFSDRAPPAPEPAPALAITADAGACECPALDAAPTADKPKKRGRKK